jgi:hypothetical protein
MLFFDLYKKAKTSYISISIFSLFYHLVDGEGEFILKTPRCDDFETFYDELIIFKELILPKYL